MTKKIVPSADLLYFLAYVRDHNLWKGSWLPSKAHPDETTHFSLRGKRGVWVKVTKDLFIEARRYIKPAPYDGKNPKLYDITPAGKRLLTKHGR